MPELNYFDAFLFQNKHSWRVSQISFHRTVLFTLGQVLPNSISVSCIRMKLWRLNISSLCENNSKTEMQPKEAVNLTRWNSMRSLDLLYQCGHVATFAKPLWGVKLGSWLRPHSYSFLKLVRSTCHKSTIAIKRFLASVTTVLPKRHRSELSVLP